MKEQIRNSLEKVIGFRKDIGKFIKKNWKIGVLLTAAAANLANFNNECLGDDYKPGKLDILNYVDDSGFFVRKHTTCHFSGRTDGFDEDFDKIYYQVYDPETKIVSIIPGYKLYVDSRNIDSETPVN